MTRMLLLSLLLISAALAGCANNDNPDNATDERDQITDELDPSNESAPGNSEQDKKLGYVRYTKDQLNNDAERDHSVRIDRTKLANMITRIILRNDGFEEVATLVTDKEVLIAYDKNDQLKEKEAAEIAKKTAVSAVPGYFHVYVSGDDTLIQDIHSLHNSNVQDDSYDNTLDIIIREMKKSPQGD
ncbi:YhcN/YlaJ family sporulation lipoprotein [Virgibacillus siamensis]|uniref:YhcN/YlaJ family sporulation lipoprotein n=1 Tax=Virgibacillus siamensis TaxID=480071 RepID=UPI0009853D9E|nr:YhcN/YlaJ family sporulation lipoprotein [Virgibacillus siamensis]